MSDDDQTTISKLDKDLRDAARRLGDDEVRFLVDAYYIVQKNRIRSANQVNSLGETPHELLGWFAKQNEFLEKQVKISLEVFAMNHPVGQWMMSQKGIGPVIASGMLAHIDITRAPTMGHIWSYAGLENGMAWTSAANAGKIVKLAMGDSPYVTMEHILAIGRDAFCDPKWLVRRCYRAATKMGIPFRNEPPTSDDRYVFTLLNDATEHGQHVKAEHVVQALSRKPWNTQLKTLCWKAGESFVKVSNYEDAVYGHIYRERKLLEELKNNNGDYADQAAHILASKRIGKTTDAYKAYSAGKLPPAHIHARSKRYAVKQFLADLHTVMYRNHFKKEPPLPYPVEHMGHAHVRRV